jgi:hypothetical protein
MSAAAATTTTTFAHDPLPFGATEHADEGTAPLPAVAPTGLSDFTVGLLGVALVAFLVYTVARTAK